MGAYYCPSCGLPLTPIPDLDGYRCGHCASTFSGLRIRNQSTSNWWRVANETEGIQDALEALEAVQLQWKAAEDPDRLHIRPTWGLAGLLEVNEQHDLMLRLIQTLRLTLITRSAAANRRRK